jgi:hypothetical protein
MKFAPRISPRLIVALDRLAARDLSAAEICRQVGDEAERLGLTRPSYQCVRLLVREARHQPVGPSVGEALAGVAYPFKPPTILMPTLPRRRARRR